MNSMMEKVIFLGTGGGMPTTVRNVASVALVFGNGDFWLFDCGEGTQQQLQRADLKISKLKKIFISHLHGDHLFGLPGLLATRGLQGIRSKIKIFGPAGMDHYLKKCFDYSRTYIPYQYLIYPIQKKNFLTKKILWKKEDYSVFCAVLNHQIDSFGYAVLERKVKRNIMVDQLKKIGIFPGPIYKDIKEKCEIILKDGQILKTADFVKESLMTRKICYCGDTMFCQNAVILARDADLLIHEATFSSQEKIEANKSFHSTIEDAVKVAQAARVKKLALNHISPRYQNLPGDLETRIKHWQRVAEKHPEIVLAEDFLEIKI